MSNFDIDIVPNIVVMNLRGNTGIFESPLTGTRQTVDRGGLHWQIAYTFTELRGDDRGVMFGLLAALRAQANQLRVPVYDNAKRGAYGGTPLVDGASQTGSSILLKSAGSVTDWIKAGDYISIDVNGEHELKLCTADATSAAGAITVNFEPRLRFSPLDNAAVYVEDGTLPKPRGLFKLTDPEINWSSRPGTQLRTTVSLQMTEDVFGTL